MRIVKSYDLGLFFAVDCERQYAEAPERRPARARRPRELREAVPGHVVEVVSAGRRCRRRPVARLGVGPTEIFQVIHFCWAEVAQIRNFDWRVAGAHAHGHIFQVMP